MCYSEIFVIHDEYDMAQRFLLFNNDNGEPNEIKRREIANAVMQIVQSANGPVSVYSIAHCHIADGRQCKCAEQNLELIAMYGNTTEGS